MKKAMAIVVLAILTLSYVSATAQRSKNVNFVAGRIALGQNDEVKKFIDAGGDVNKRFAFGKTRDWTLLIWAAYLNNSEATRMLTKAGADVNLKTKKGGTALISALTGGSLKNNGINIDVVKALLEAGADVNEQIESEGLSPLMLAAAFGQAEVVKLLLDKGADVNAKARNGETALMAARRKGHQDIVNLLIEPGAKR